MRIAISLLYGAMHSSQEMTGNDAALGGMLGVATEPSLWIAYFFISVIGPISEEVVFRGYFKKLFCLNGHFGLVPSRDGVSMAILASSCDTMASQRPFGSRHATCQRHF